MRSDNRRQETPPTIWPFVVVGAAPLVLFWPIVFGGKVMFWGLPLLQFYPWRHLVRRALLSGRLPLWNDLLGNGAPLLANYQSAVFYPPNWLDLLLPLDYSIGLTTTLHYVWAGLGMVALARALGLGRFGQAVAGLAFCLSGYFVARLSFISIISAAAWLPWMIWATESGMAQLGINGSGIGAARYWWMLTLCAAMQLLAGHAQTAFYSWLLAAAWALARSRTAIRHSLFAIRHSPFATRHSLLAIRHSLLAIRHPLFAIPLTLAASLALAAALAAGQLLPTFELMRASQRASGADYDFAMTYSMWPWRLITLLAPDFFGNPADGDYWGYGNYWEDAAYTGVLPLGLAGLAGAMWLAERRRAADFASRSPAPFLFGVALVSILLALGKNTPVFPFLYRHVPPFNLFQAPARALIGYVFAVSLLAGIGAEAWRRPKGRALYWTRLGVAGAAAIGLAAGLAALTLEVKSTFLGAAGLLSVWASGAFILSLLKPEASGGGTGRWQAACLGFVALDLVAAGYRLNPYLPPTLYRNATLSGVYLREYLDGHRLFWFGGDEYKARFERWFLFETFGPPMVDYWLAVRESQLSNLNVLDGIASANNFDPLLPARYSGLLAALETAPPEAAGRILRAMDVRAVIGARPPGEWETAYSGEGWEAYTVPGASSRARVVYAARAMPDEAAALAAVLDSSFDPDSTVVLEVGGVGVSGVNSEPQVQSQRDFQSQPVRLLTNSPEVITISASLRRDGWVVLADTYYPGWRAFVDGRQTPILPANYAFRAVAVPAGEHTVEFRYQPPTLRLGLSVSVIAWLTGITVGIVMRRRV